ncbi:MAG: EFR1 family ferrodoxin [Corallococcus sp.]|nr:EFR1 family ferrodoxin [Corallococcus sp.]MCM1359342.1 EFR1 family ferrodoxin [Corallococcus sp.]MCM1394785.1 EFR1 family ferrodoxin [Corallococcus sp.]
MQAIIYYFSGTGNTKMVCEKFGLQLQNRGVECTICPMSLCEPAPDPNGFDFVGFAYPVHGFNAPYIVYKFVQKLPAVQGKNFFILKTSGEPVAMNHASSLHLSAKIRERGFSVLTNEYHYVMPYNMIFRHTDLQAQKMWQTAQKLVEVDVDELLSGTPHRLDAPLFGRFIAWVLRIEHGAMKLNGKSFKVTDKCVKCMKCVNNCPVDNVSYDEKTGKFKFGSKCIMCARCSFHCPKDAIQIGILNGWRVNGAYNFDNPDLTQLCKKPDYCKKSYQRYFENSERRINAYLQKSAPVSTGLREVVEQVEAVEDMCMHTLTKN